MAIRVMMTRMYPRPGGSITVVRSSGRRGTDISKSGYYYDTIIRYYISVIMCYNVL